jgi:hypothetical protein
VTLDNLDEVLDTADVAAHEDPDIVQADPEAVVDPDVAVKPDGVNAEEAEADTNSDGSPGRHSSVRIEVTDQSPKA